MLAGFAMLAALLFVPAGTWQFYQAWVMLGVLFVPMAIMGAVMLVKNPELLSKRLNAKEKEQEQKWVVALSGILFVANFVVAGLNFRYGWCVLLDEILYLNAEAYTPVDGNVAVTGEVTKVENTPFDFRTPTRVGDRINDTTHQQIVNGRGYDHNWLLNTHGDIHAVAATLYDPTSGIQMTIYTDQPGVQFYAGNFLDGSFMGKGGIAYPKRSGLCFETQHYPDSPNQPHFPSTTLRPGEQYTTTTIYKFTIN